MNNKSKINILNNKLLSSKVPTMELVLEGQLLTLSSQNFRETTPPTQRSTNP